MRNKYKMGQLITVIIPCKNEQNTIGALLHTLSIQTIKPKQIIIADNNSTDNTLNIIKDFIGNDNPLNIEVIQGGLVAYGRNQGARLADTKYLIFIDADMDLQYIGLLQETVELMERKSLHMATTNIRCNSNNLKCDFVYMLNNVGQHIAKFINSPFSTGAYMCITKKKFNKLGGFDEDLQFCEDYWLSKQIKKRKFGIVNSKIYTSDRRFKKMGYWWMIKNFINSYLNRNNRDYFTKDFKYWI